jgi:hypothetical protein
VGQLGFTQLCSAHLILPFVVPSWRVSTRCSCSFRASRVPTTSRGISVVAPVCLDRRWLAGAGGGSLPPERFEPLRLQDSLARAISSLEQQPGERVKPVQQETHLFPQVLRAVQASMPAPEKHQMDTKMDMHVCPLACFGVPSHDQAAAVAPWL